MKVRLLTFFPCISLPFMIEQQIGWDYCHSSRLPDSVEPDVSRDFLSTVSLPFHQEEDRIRSPVPGTKSHDEIRMAVPVEGFLSVCDVAFHGRKSPIRAWDERSRLSRILPVRRSSWLLDNEAGRGNELACLFRQHIRSGRSAKGFGRN